MLNPKEYFNRHLEQDLIAVLDASSALEVTEFRLFELAFKDWFGKKADQAKMEKYFAAYMFAHRVPGWVRHFSRKILKLQTQGQLDPRAFGVWYRLPSARMILVAKIYTASLLIILLLSTVLIYSLPQKLLAVFEQCYFPPCY